MQRKPTKNTRGPNAQEKRFQGWLKEQPCCVCESIGPSIVHHCEGATFRNNKVLVGHAFCISLCYSCDSIVTLQSRKVFRSMFGAQSELWVAQYYSYLEGVVSAFDEEIPRAIELWGK